LPLLRIVALRPELSFPTNREEGGATLFSRNLGDKSWVNRIAGYQHVGFCWGYQRISGSVVGSGLDKKIWGIELGWSFEKKKVLAKHIKFVFLGRILLSRGFFSAFSRIFYRSKSQTTTSLSNR
jgi:hypothetical protein